MPTTRSGAVSFEPAPKPTQMTPRKRASSIGPVPATKRGKKKAPKERSLSLSDEKKQASQVKAERKQKMTEPKKEDQNSSPVVKEEGVSESTDKKQATVPSSILEKGIIYFFFRGRTNVENVHGVEEVARSYIILRPLPIGAQLGEGPLEDGSKSRLLALPKKTLPKRRGERFLVFVEKANAGVKELKENFVSGSEYTTKTTGVSHKPPATPVAEGVYAIASAGRNSHLVYHVTAPAIGEIQRDMGIQEKGSFVVPVRNPNFPGPPNANFRKQAEYPEEIMQKFRGLRWMPLVPEAVDYENAQLLLIGEGLEIIEKTPEEPEDDEMDETKETPIEEFEKLQDEDQMRVEHLKGDDPVFIDLGMSSKNMRMRTTW